MHIGDPHLWVRAHRRSYRALGIHGWPKWVSCSKSQEKMAKYPKLGHTRPPHSTSPPPPTPPQGVVPPPQTHVEDPHLWVRTHQRAYMALGMGGQNGCPAENFVPISYHGHYHQVFPHHTISYQFTIVMRYCSNRWTKS